MQTACIATNRIGTRLRRVAAIVLVSTLGTMLGFAPADAQANGSIAGTVPPLGLSSFSICVTAVDVGSGATGGTATADNFTGQYSVSVPPGVYVVWFVPCGLRAALGPAVALYHDAASYDAATAVPVAEGATTTLLHQSLPPGGSVAGTVTDADGRAVADCLVLALTRTPIPTLVGAAATSALGRYAVSNLPVGEIDVLAACGSGFVNTYHGDTTDPAQSVPVSITVGGGPEANVTAERSPRSVAGRATGTNGLVADGACAYAYTADGQVLGSSSLRGDGSWAIADLPPGVVRIGFIGCVPNAAYVPEWYDGIGEFAAATPVSVPNDAATTQIDAVLTRYTGLSFSFTDAAASPIAGVCVGVTDTSGTTVVSIVFAEASTVDINGLLPGDYSVLFTDCNTNRFPSEWYEDAPDHATSTPLTAVEGVVEVTPVVLG